MAGGSRIIAFGSGNQDDESGQEFLLTQEAETASAEEWQPEVDETPLPNPRRSWIPAALCSTAIAGWTGFFGWARQAELIAPPPAALTALVADWATPVVLVLAVWLLAMRHSRREAQRFGDVAASLSAESERLEHRLAAANRELSLAREFIAAQSRDLDSLGRMAADRLSQSADRLQSLIHDNGARIDSIGTVSEAALDNMEKLRGHLPVIASSAKDVTNNIGNAGRTAHAQLQEMITAFKRLNEFGLASERQVGSLRTLVEETLGEFTRQVDHLGDVMAQRYSALSDRGTEFRLQLDTHEVEALAAIRTRANAMAEELEQTRRLLDEQEAESLTSLRARLSSLRDEGQAVARALRDGEVRATDEWRSAVDRLESDAQATAAAIAAAREAAATAAAASLADLRSEAQAFEARLAETGDQLRAELAKRRREASEAEQEALDRLAEQLAGIDRSLAERQAQHAEHAESLALRASDISERMEAIGERMAAVAEQGREAEGLLASSIHALSLRLSETRNTLSGTDRQIADLTDASVRLLELIQASAQHSRTELASALATGEEQLAAIEQRVTMLTDRVDSARAGGEELAGSVEGVGERLSALSASLGTLQSSLVRQGADHAAALDALTATLATLERRSGELTERTRSELQSSIDSLSAAAQTAIAEIGGSGPAAISALARQLAEESSAAIEKAMRATAAETAGKVEQVAAHAAGITREATIQLRDQLARVDELAGNLERRVAQARERAEEHVDNDFARRAALINEALNSNAIDIAKALSTDVADTAWAAYLRGDRGIFTRRAVSLLDATEARSVAQIYDTDREFREHVSRYIHDFESILRQVLSTRDGHALGVTLLSSDMGKLYVALAQAIERLRT